MAAVFTPAQTFNGSFRSDLLKLTFGGVGAGMLVQNVQFSYQQQVNTVYEIGSTNVYYIGGHAQGTAGMSRIVGPGPAIGAFFAKYGNICEPGNIEFSATGGCGGAAGEVNYRLEAAIMTSVGAQVNANDIVINEQVGLQFANLDVS